MAKQLPQKLLDMKEKVLVEDSGVRYTSTMSDYDAFASLGLDNAFSIKNFLNNFSMKIISINKKENSMIVDIKGIDTSIANALRRILVSEVPTMAIEEVTIVQNTSVIQDEVLCHRLGLLPLKIDATMWPFVKNNRMDASNTLIFKINVECCDKTRVVYSKDVEWVEQVGQKAKLISNGYSENDLPLSCVYDDIIVAKLGKGQKIEAWMKVVKGIGRDHAKFSPVGTAFYRLLPHISFQTQSKTIENIEDAHILINNCPKNVFDLTDNQSKKSVTENGYIKVSRPRDCSMCRACISQSHGLPNKVKLERIKNHFIFQIESIGQYNVTQLLSQAIQILTDKCKTLQDHIELIENNQNNQENDNDDDSDMENID